MDKMMKMRERLADTLDSLALAMQNLQRGRTFKEEPRVSKVNNVAASFEKYQALLEVIREALSFF
ncbi:hypothetical protein KI387_036755, partial [Taxus chinensis]